MKEGANNLSFGDIQDFISQIPVWQQNILTLWNDNDHAKLSDELQKSSPTLIATDGGYWIP